MPYNQAQSERVIVIDNGGCSCKVGLAGEKDAL